MLIFFILWIAGVALGITVAQMRGETGCNGDCDQGRKCDCVGRKK
jgi:hypothetical protein